MDNYKNKRYMINKEYATFIGNLEYGAIVRVTHLNEDGVALIDSGYTQDEIMFTDLLEVVEDK